MNIRFDQVLERALIGLRRSYVFMGLGVNSANIKEFVDFQLTSITQIQLMPNVEDIVVIDDFKDNYKEWVLNNAFREALESFHSYIDELSSCCLIAKFAKIDLSEANRLHKTFERKPFPEKMNYLNHEFNIVPESLENINSINKVRNCLAHRRGVVSAKDINDGSKNVLKFGWRAMNYVFRDVDGEKEFHPNEVAGYVTKHETTLAIKFVNRSKEFKLGESISFEPQELAEILWYWTFEINKLLNLSVDYAKTQGVIVSQKDS